MRKTWCLVVTFMLAAAAVAAAPPGFTADELVQKNIAALGGREKLAAIHSLKFTGTTSFGGGDFILHMPCVTYQKRPGLLREERTMQGLTAITAYDGTDAWSLQPFGGRRDPDRLPPDVVKLLAVAADIDTPLVDYAKKGHRVEYLGTEDVDGTDAHKLKVTLAGGNMHYYYLDPDYFLVIRVVTQTKIRGVEQEQETDFSDYELVDGVYMPLAIESGPKGGPHGYKQEWEKVETNVPIDDSMFAFPAPAKDPAQ